MLELAKPLLSIDTELTDSNADFKADQLGKAEPIKSVEKVESYMSEVRSMIESVEKFVEENTQSVIQVPFKINTFALTQDSKNLIYATTNGNIAQFSIRKKIIKNDVPLSTGNLFAILLTKDEKHILVTGEESVIHVFSYPSLEHVKSMEGHEETVMRIIQTPDGKTMFSCSEDSTVRRWNLDDFSGGEVLIRHEGKCKSIALEPNGRYLFSGGEDQLIRVYDIQSETVIQQLSGHTNWIWALAVSHDSKYLISGSSDKQIKLWDISTLECIKTFTGHTSRLTSLQFSPDDQFIVSASSDTTLRVWPLNSGAPPRVLTGHTNWVRDFIITYDQKYIYSAGEDSTFRIWSFPTEIIDNQLTTHEDCIQTMSVCDQGGALVTAGDDRKVKLWNIRDSAFDNDIEELESKITCGTITKDDRYYIAATENGFVYVFDMKTHTRISCKKAHVGGIRSIGLNSDDSLLMTGGTIDSRVCIFYLKSLECKTILRGHSNWIWSVAFSYDSKYAITGSSDNTVKIWDIETRKCLSTLTTHLNRICWISITKDSQTLVTGDYNGKVYIWNFPERRIETTLNTHENVLTGVYITSDQSSLITSDIYGKLNIFDLKTRQTITTLSLGRIDCFALDPQETSIYYSNDNISYFIKNPLKVTELSVFGNGDKSDYIQYLHSIMIEKKNIKQDLKMDEWIIMPYKINLLHIYAYYGMNEYLENSVNNSFSLLKSMNNETALTIGLYRKSYESLENILMKLCEEVKNNMFLMSIIEDAIVLLNQFGNANLTKVYDTILRVCDQPSLPKFCMEKYSFPIHYMNDSIKVNPDNFISPEDKTNEGELILFKESLIKFNFSSGSKWSIEFLSSILDSPNQNIFRSQYIQSILIYKWKNLRYYMNLQAAIYLVYMMILSVQILSGTNDTLTILSIFIINFALLLFEVFQMLVAGKRYWTDFWNYLDIVRSLTCMIYYSMFYVDLGKEWNYELLAVVTLVSWIRGISYFRIFQKTRYIINLLTEVINDMKAFMCVLVYSSLSFTFLFLVIKNESNFPAYILGTFKMNLGDVADGYENSILEFSLLTVAIIINPIIMLNLLISIIGDTFDRVQSTMVIADMRELCEMIIELESMLYWKRESGTLQYLQLCNSRESEELIEDQWEGKIRQLDDKLERILDKVSSIDTSNVSILDKLSNIQGSINKLSNS